MKKIKLVSCKCFLSTYSGEENKICGNAYDEEGNLYKVVWTQYEGYDPNSADSPISDEDACDWEHPDYILDDNYKDVTNQVEMCGVLWA